MNIYHKYKINLKIDAWKIQDIKFDNIHRAHY